MQYITLGDHGPRVSRVCLGTMTFGQQNSEAEAHAQLDAAFARGVNFIDTAEMYPVPARAETSGRSEEYVGAWLARQPRDKVILASKATGPARGMAWIRAGKHHFSRDNLRLALEGSLRRLRTDHLDLYQLHWPDRNVPMFGAYHFDPGQERDSTPLLETLGTLAEFIQAGKIRHWGASNETPWGLMTYLRLADAHGLPRPVSVQNAYSLLNRTWENGLAEIGHRENVGLLAYSPLGFGHLSGKYLKDPAAQGRATLFPEFTARYRKPNTAKALAAYVELAERHGLSPSSLALAFAHNRWCVAATILGATSLAQLREDLDATEMSLAPDVLREIERIHLDTPNPAP